MSGVVVTGIGVISAAGPGFENLVEVLRSNRTAAGPYDTALPLNQAAEVRTPVKPVDGFEDDRKAWLALHND